MAKKINVAFVGAGYWGQKLLPKFLAAPQTAVRVVCDIHAGNRAAVQQKFPEVFTAELFESILIDQEIDAVVIVTPPATHFDLAKKALEAGKHVWVEKPLALRVNEGRELVRLAQAKRIVLFVDHTFLYDPAVTIVREMIRKEELGHIYHLYLQRLNLGRIKRDSNVWWNSAPHDASIVLYLSNGRPKNIHLHGYRYLQPHLEDLNIAVIEMTDGTSAFIYHNWLYPENTAKLTVIGSKRLLVYEGKFEKRSITVYDHQIGSLKQDQPSVEHLATTIPSKMLAERKLEGFQDQEPLAAAVKDFLESIRDDRLPLSNGDFSLQVLAVLEAGERSVRSHGDKIAVEF
jgi:UDP-2-acetamido-3-amino-2,3-dideoxy-glucuronate N-acetyltransferase